MPKIDNAVSRIMRSIPNEMRIPLTQAIEKEYGETGNGTIMATSLLEYSQEYLSAYFYDQLVAVFGLEE